MAAWQHEAMGTAEHASSPCMSQSLITAFRSIASQQCPQEPLHATRPPTAYVCLLLCAPACERRPTAYVRSLLYAPACARRPTAYMRLLLYAPACERPPTAYAYSM
eukprot:scaffold184891_cov19-Tisochrysis_lutea.AAC.1